VNGIRKSSMYIVACLLFNYTLVHYGIKSKFKKREINQLIESEGSRRMGGILGSSCSTASNGAILLHFEDDPSSLLLGS